MAGDLEGAIADYDRAHQLNQTKSQHAWTEGDNAQKFRLMVLDDPNLEPLWASLSATEACESSIAVNSSAGHQSLSDLCNGAAEELECATGEQARRAQCRTAVFPVK